jgi:hypothetical protein
MPLHYKFEDESESCDNGISFCPDSYNPQDSQSSRSEVITLVVEGNVSLCDTQTLIRELDRCTMDISPNRQRIEEDLVNQWLSLNDFERSFEMKESYMDYMVEPCNDSLILSRRRLQRRKPNSKLKSNKCNKLL